MSLHGDDKKKNEEKKKVLGVINYTWMMSNIWKNNIAKYMVKLAYTW